jgi:Phage integrase, N-terminal SAM-like domain
MDLMPAVDLTSLRFEGACTTWLESRQPYLKAKTFHEYQLNIKTLAAFFGELRLTEIDGDLVRAYQRMRQARSGAYGINHECGLLM